MEQVINDYSKAVDAYIKAVRKETMTKVEVQQKRATLMKAKEAMRDMEYDLIDPVNFLK